jgi:hypothetical protein
MAVVDDVDSLLDAAVVEREEMPATEREQVAHAQSAEGLRRERAGVEREALISGSNVHDRGSRAVGVGGDRIGAGLDRLVAGSEGREARPGERVAQRCGGGSPRLVEGADHSGRVGVMQSQLAVVAK